MKRRMLFSLAAGGSLLATGCTSTRPPASAPAPAPQGTGDLGVVIERAAGALTLINTSQRASIGRQGHIRRDIAHQHYHRLAGFVFGCRYALLHRLGDRDLGN